ncbi:MAG: FAD-binding oxidoreductase [PVC group bacterium]|nr:FAD-binding oxidoreductase [PVC group bacterium]
MIRKNDKTTFSDYLEDSSGLSGGCAQEIIFPESVLELTEFIREAADKELKLTVSGGGTGVVGGRVPYGGAILATDRLDKIYNIEKSKTSSGGLAIVEAGVRLEDLNNEAAKQGLVYRPDPTEKNAFLGGTIATNASGAQGFKYGATRNYIQRLWVVLASGDLLEIRRGDTVLGDSLCITLPENKVIQCSITNCKLFDLKSTAGYFVAPGTDLIDLFIGQEGTLGIITQAEVRLEALPKSSIAGMVFFQDEILAMSFVDTIKKYSYRSRKDNKQNEIDAGCIEFFDEGSLNILSEVYSQLPFGKKSAVYFEQDIIDVDEMVIMEKYAEVIESLNVSAADVWFADTDKNRKLLTNMRHELPVRINERVKSNGFSKISTDCAVADDQFSALFDFYKRKLNDGEIPYCMFGHIGENHLHVNMMPENKTDFDRAKQMYFEFLTEAVRLGGTIAAEHGIGKLKREYLKIMLGQAQMRQMAQIKRALDPGLILGSGNILDEEYLK